MCVLLLYLQTIVVIEGGLVMITRRKALIVVSGSKAEASMPALTNHEAIIKVKHQSEIPETFRRNKTPICTLDTLENQFCSYVGQIVLLNTNIYLTSLEQPTLTQEFTRFCYKCQIEPGEFVVPNVANNSSDGCPFCCITKHSGLSTAEYNKTCKLVDMIIYESEHFVVVPGLGPLAPGYLMIMSKDHYLSLAQVPAEWYDEHHEIEEDFEFILGNMYHLPVTFAEHGTAPGGAVGLKSLVHEHVHIMIDNVLSSYYKEMLCMHPVETMKDLAPIAYFSHKSGASGQLWATTDPQVYLQRQIHRQIYAEKHNLATDQFNWRKTEFADRTKTNVWQLFRYLSDTAPLTDRIIERTSSFVSVAGDRF